MPTLPTNFRPDYGLFCLEQNEPDEEYNFCPFILFSIDRVDEGLFCSTANAPFYGKEYAVTMDFPLTIYKDLCRAVLEIDLAVGTQLIGFVGERHTQPKRLKLARAISANLKRKLGKKYTNNNESYVPFVVTAILK